MEKNPSHASQKMPQGNAGIAIRWFRAGPLSILVFKSWHPAMVVVDRSRSIGEVNL